MNWKTAAIIGTGAGWVYYEWYKLNRTHNDRFAKIGSFVLMSAFLAPEIYYSYRFIDANTWKDKYQVIKDFGNFTWDFWTAD